MGQLSKFLRLEVSGIAHWCPGCEEMHVIATSRPQSNGAHWSWDGNVDAPTCSPSVNISWGRLADPTAEEDPDIPSGRCHYFLRAGQIEYCGDSTHPLAGKVVPLPELPDFLKD